MGTDAGACGAFGILISDYLDDSPEMSDLKDQLTALEADAEENSEDPDQDGEKLAVIGSIFIKRLKERGFDVPKEASLLWTGSDADRPARCESLAEEWVLGFGLFTKPWDYPAEFPQWFRDNAQFHTWVWMG